MTHPHTLLLLLQELYPKLQIDISLQVLEDGGNVLTCAVLCAAVAMVTGGIQMKDIPIACKVVGTGIYNVYCLK